MLLSSFPAFFNTLAIGTDRAFFALRGQFWLLRVAAAIHCLHATPAPGGELEDQLGAICRSQDVPGIIAASVGPDGVIESACAGVRKHGTEDAITIGDQFALGSNSKSFTSTLAAVFVDKGEIA